MAQRPGKSRKDLEAHKKRIRAEILARRRARMARERMLEARRRRMIRAGVMLLIWLTVSFGGTLVYFGYDLPEKVNLDVAGRRRPSVKVTDMNGQTLVDYGNLYGRPVEVGDLPRPVVRAFLAAEDRRFYDHFGIDLIGIARASWANLTSRRVVQGGSTITQQLAKVLFLTPERSFSRKIQEMMLALWLEWTFEKNQILSLYLNRVYFGSGIYGLDAAARRYFGKPPADLGLFEAAVLAGLPQAPSRYNPLRSPEAAARRANRVLEAMASAGFATRLDVDRQRRRTVVTAVDDRPGQGIRYFSDWVLEQVPQLVGYRDRDLVVQTTLDRRLQDLAELYVRRTLDSQQARNMKVGQAAMVVMTPDGAVRAMVGGKDYRQSQFNRVTQARRQPGSAFKLFVYLAGMETGLKPSSWVRDGPVKVDGWAPRNFDRTYRGTISVRDAMAFSVNSVAVQLGLEVGLERVVANARRMGVSTPLRAEPSLALGSSEVTMLELAGAYAIIANGGYAAFPHAIIEIAERRGETLYKRSTAFPKRLINPISVGGMNNMLAQVVSKGTGKGAVIDRPSAGKTGTTQNFRDAWFIGYTAELVAAVWMGNDNNTPMDGVTGGGLPARLWRDYMLQAHQNMPVRSLGKATLQRASRAGDADAWREFTTGFSGDTN